MSLDATVPTALAKTSEIIGADVSDGRGHKIATIRELYFDLASGQAQFAIVEAAGLLGSGGKYHPVPWSALRHDPARNGYVAPFNKDRLKAGPAYDRDQLNSPAYGWEAQVRSYYGG